MPNEKILICDDEPGMRLVLTNVLKPEGYSVLQAEDGAQAIETIKAEKPNLLLLDMRLPDMDGLEILAEAKKISPQMPVLMLSGFSDVESAVGAMKQGAFDYLSKPFRVEDVRRLVQKALGSQTLSKEGLMEKEARPSGGSAATAEKLLSAAAPKPRAKGKIWAGIGLLLSLAAAGAGFWLVRDRFISPLPDKGFPIPYTNPTALCYAGDKTLWAADWVTSSLYKHNLDQKLSVAQIVQLPGGHPTGIAWDGVNLWTCNSWEQKIYKHGMDAGLSVAAEYPSPGPEPAGLYWDGVNLWVCDYKEGKFYRMKVSEEGLTVLNAYDSPGPRPVGLFITPDNLWSADAETNRIYKHAKDNTLTVIAVYVASSYKDRKNFISGLAWDGKYIWSCADEHADIHRHNPRNLEGQKL
ncbi:MAG: response regulator [Elusimicrobia bacterium]|nr:response regulator [Elusimicrobiota bacterium]